MHVLLSCLVLPGGDVEDGGGGDGVRLETSLGLGFKALGGGTLTEKIRNLLRVRNANKLTTLQLTRPFLTAFFHHFGASFAFFLVFSERKRKRKRESLGGERE